MGFPNLPGKDLDGITTLQSMEDADYLKKIAVEKKVKKAVIVGGGLIGIETCEALQLAGIEVTIVEMLDQVLSFLDWEMAKLVENHMVAHGVSVKTGSGVAEFQGKEGKLTGVKLANGEVLPSDLAVVSIGVRPNSKIAKDAGLDVGRSGGITVNRFMQTYDADIYAAGDCVEVTNLVTPPESARYLNTPREAPDYLRRWHGLKGTGISLPQFTPPRTSPDSWVENHSSLS
jgi:NADPH-dependent 2,4-dienoyl-CoA reductase/sulfur reductase-like enzyme